MSDGIEFQTAGKTASSVPSFASTRVAEKENAGIKSTVTAELEVNGQKFNDTNQTARPIDQANKDEFTLISDRISAKEQSLIDKGKTGNLPLPSSNMANAHAEIGVIQQAYSAGKTQDADLMINVAGKDVCSYCKGDIVAAKASGALIIKQDCQRLTYGNQA